MKSSGSWQVKWERNMDELVQAQIDKTNEYASSRSASRPCSREGFEAAIFVVGFGAAYRPESMPIPIVTGIFAGVAFGASMFVGTNKMDLSLFFKFSAGFLALIAAGLGSHASYEFQKGEAFGAWACKRICDDVWVPAVQAPFARRVPHVPYTDIAPHAAIDLDVLDFEAALEAGEWDAAWAVYADGAHSAKGDGLRTLRGFSEDLSGEKTFDEYMAYHQNAKYADDYVRAALWDRLSDDSSAKVDPRPALFATATLSDAMAVELALKGAQYQHTWIYSTHELYSALGKCEAGDVDEAAPHAWDEGWAFYAGSTTGADGDERGALGYGLGERRCANFGTCADDGLPAWRSEDEGAAANANAKLLRLYEAGLKDIQDADRCGDARAYVDDIVAQMTVPLVQGTLRYAYRSSPEGTAEALGSDGKVWAEFHAFGYALLPRVHACDASAGAALAAALEAPDVIDEATAGDLVPGGFAAVKAALESTYACLGITCADVGGLQAGDGSPIEGMGACADGSSIDDGAAYFDALEEIGARPDGDWEEENCDDDEADASWHSYRRLEAEPWYDALVEQVPEAYGRKLVTERAKSCDGKGQSIAWPNEEVWDITGCCDTKNGFFFLMMVLFWYRPAITNLELIIWVIYWPIIAFWGWYKVRDITDFNADLQAAADAKGEEDLKPEAE
ncbi:hypothetical protein SO694_00026043 [Aureococcus anophagefferens]|uniref:Uncharacterized protein n=1 Tax=Aureococcus anophagefferens TaxID=44056 RepID=A0ABR1FUF6_AURAN